jgi:hypothetical protein
MVTPAYQPRDPSSTVLYQVIADHLETFLATLDADPMATGLPGYVKEEFSAYLQCGILAHGFVRLGCDTCPRTMVLAFSCKRRGFCPSCAGRRMAQLAAHLHYHMLFFGGVYVDRSEKGLTPRFVTVARPSNAAIAAVVATISQRVIRKLRRMRYLEAGIAAAVATGYDPLGEDEPELARTMAASVQQRMAFGERAGAGRPRHLRLDLALTRHRLFPCLLGRSGPRCARSASRRPLAASTSACKTSHGAAGGVFRGRRVVCAPTRGRSRGVSRIRTTGGRHAKSALKYLYVIRRYIVRRSLLHDP